MERIVEIKPAWDKRNSNPSKNFGVHGCELRMVVKGESGAVQFVLFTNWYLPSVEKELDGKGEFFFKPLPADLGYHSPKPMYDGQEPISESCEYVTDGQPCYYDGSGLNAEKVFDILREGGSNSVWGYLEEYYIDVFGELK